MASSGVDTMQSMSALHMVTARCGRATAFLFLRGCSNLQFGSPIFDSVLGLGMKSRPPSFKPFSYPATAGVHVFQNPLGTLLRLASAQGC